MSKSKSFLVLLLLTLLSGCSVWNTAKFAYDITTGSISGAYNIVTTGISLLHSFYKAIDKWADKRVASQKVYVKYTHDYENRAIINYETGIITVETIDDKDPYISLQDAIVTTLLTPDDPRVIDLYSSDDISLGQTPFLLGQVLDNHGQPIRTKAQAISFAKYLIETKVKSYNESFDNYTQSVFGVSFNLVVGHEYLRAQKFLPFVMEYSQKYKVSKSLIMAIIETESAFNPFAISSTGALGLMQIMQKSAGKEVYKYLHGKSLEPPRDTLFQPKFNIQYGTIYLHLLSTRYFGSVKSRLSREYCVIAAYNTGPSNVLRSFSSDKNKALSKINSMQPEALFNYLESHLPYEETRRYIVKVRNAKKKY